MSKIDKFYMPCHIYTYRSCFGLSDFVSSPHINKTKVGDLSLG